MGRPMREDVPVLDVALKWLDGQPILVIASEYGVATNMIQRRIKKAREMYPDLPWDEREPAQQPGPTQAYVQMNDGKPGTRGVRPGSIIRGSSKRMK